MFICIIISLSCFVNYKLRFLLQFTRTLLRSDSVLARKSERRRVRRERHFMSKKSCKAAESIEDALLRMARVNSNNFSASSRTQHHRHRTDQDAKIRQIEYHAIDRCDSCFQADIIHDIFPHHAVVGIRKSAAQ